MTRSESNSLAMAIASSILSVRNSSEVPKLENESIATLGVTPNRRATFAVCTAISARVLASGYMLMVASPMNMSWPFTVIMYIPTILCESGSGPMVCRHGLTMSG